MTTHDMSPQPSYDWPRDGSKLYFVSGSGSADLFEATWRLGSCPSDFQGELAEDNLVRLRWTNGAIVPSSVDVFRNDEIIAEDAPAEPPEFQDTPGDGIHTYRLEFNVPGVDCPDLTTVVDNRPPCDTHCSGIRAELIDESGANVGVAVDAHDDTGGEIAYSLVARKGVATTVRAGPQAENVFELDLEPGDWTIWARVSDDSACNPPATDYQCAPVIINVPPPCDTHCRTLTVELVNGPGTNVRATATAEGDSGGTLLYLFRADDGAGNVVELGPQLSGVANFSLPPGEYTITVTASDDSRCHPHAHDASCTVPFTVPGRHFTRGDANADGKTDIADPIWVLNYLFAGGPAPTCLQSADANDDNAVNIADPTYELNHLFNGGPPLPPPVGECGTDPTPAGDPADDLGCEAFGPCYA